MVKQPKSKLIITLLVIGVIILMSNNQEVKKESLYDSRFSCDARYQSELDSGDQCVVLVEPMTQELINCFNSCPGSTGVDSDAVCAVFAEPDPCRTTKGGSFGDGDACDYNCILNSGGPTDPCPNDCTVGETRIDGSTCDMCFEGDGNSCNEWIQTSMDVCDGGSNGGTCTPSSWAPLQSAVCDGVPFLQTSDCDTTRTNVGTKSCASGDGGDSGGEEFSFDINKWIPYIIGFVALIVVVSMLGKKK
jgi:hypothetical protein